MGMFTLPKDTLKLPKGARETFVVRYQGGRKPFPSRKDADAFSKACREAEKGWAEVIRQIEIVVSPR